MKTQPLKVLVIGDDGAAPKPALDALHRLGHQVDGARDACSAFGRDLSEYTAILIDEDPFEDTLDSLVAEVRRRAPGAGVVIIASSSDDDLVSRHEMADDCLTKPVTPNQVRLSMARVAKLQQMKQSSRDADRFSALGRMSAVLAHEGRDVLSMSSLAADLLEFDLEGCPRLLTLTSTIRSSHSRLRRLFDEICGYAARSR
jgi:DNA-binding NtrC family response regulator